MIVAAKRDRPKKQTSAPSVVGPGQCGVRMYERDSPRHKLRHTMTCTLPLGHEKDVHEEYQDGKWMGGWVDRAPDPEANWQQFPRVVPTGSDAGGGS